MFSIRTGEAGEVFLYKNDALLLRHSAEQGLLAALPRRMSRFIRC